MGEIRVNDAASQRKREKLMFVLFEFIEFVKNGSGNFGEQIYYRL